MGSALGRPALLVVALIAFAPSATLSAQTIADGTWTGVTRRGNGVPLGTVLTLRTVRDVQTVSIATLSCPQGCPLDAPRLAGDTLSFSWTAPAGAVTCRLIAHHRDRYRGTCLAGRDSIFMSLRGPELTEQWGPLGVARFLLDEAGVRWEERSWDNIRLYAPRDSKAARHLKALEHEARAAVADVAKVLNLPADYTEPVDLFFVDSRDDMQRMLSVPVGGYSDPVSRTAVLVVDSLGHSPVRHELAHIVSWRTWGPPGPLIDWMQEGFAVMFEWRACQDELFAVSGFLEGQGALITTDALINGFRDFDSAVTYIQAGSLSKYIFQRYGLSAFREVWHRGMDQLAYVTKTTVPRLEGDWRQWIKDHEKTPSRDWHRMIDGSCQ